MVGPGQLSLARGRDGQSFGASGVVMGPCRDALGSRKDRAGMSCAESVRAGMCGRVDRVVQPGAVVTWEVAGGVVA